MSKSVLLKAEIFNTLYNMGLDLGSMIGGGLQVAGAVYGGIKASKAMRDIKKSIEAQKRDNRAWYDRRYNEDATQRADAQRLLQATEERIRQRNKAAAGQAAIGGASTEAAAAQAEANSAEMANTTAAINASAANRKDNIENQFRANNAALDDQLNKYRANNAAQIAQAAQAAMNAGAGIATAEFPKKVKDEA